MARVRTSSRKNSKAEAEADSLKMAYQDGLKPKASDWEANLTRGRHGECKERITGGDPNAIDTALGSMQNIQTRLTHMINQLVAGRAVEG